MSNSKMLSVAYGGELMELEAFTWLSAGIIGYEAQRADLEAKYAEYWEASVSDALTDWDIFRNYKTVTEFVKHQFNNKFPYIFEIAAIRVWSILEAAVDDLALYALNNIQRSRESDAVKNLKGTLIEFISLSTDEQSEYLLEQLKRQTNASSKQGIGQFESILGNLGLGGGIDDIVRTSLFELSQIRNVLVHRNGKVDNRLVRNCPWLNIELGKRVVLTRNHYYAYQYSAVLYLIELDTRRLVAEGLDNFMEESPSIEFRANISRKLKEVASKYRQFKDEEDRI